MTPPYVIYYNIFKRKDKNDIFVDARYICYSDIINLKKKVKKRINNAVVESHIVCSYSVAYAQIFFFFIK